MSIVTRGLARGLYVGAIVLSGFGRALVGPYDHGVLPPGGIVFSRPATTEFVFTDGLFIER